MNYEMLIGVVMCIDEVFWDVTRCRWNSCWRSGGTCYLHSGLL